VALLCQMAKITRMRSFGKICEAGAHGTTFFLLIRGAARVYTHHEMEDGKTVLKYEEDLVPGDVFGETVLDGLYTRFATVQAMTVCDVAVFELSDYSSAQDRCVCVCVCVFVCVCMYVCKYVCMCVYVCLHVYMHILLVL
jgi:hypothetical protein